MENNSIYVLLRKYNGYTLKDFIDELSILDSDSKVYFPYDEVRETTIMYIQQNKENRQHVFNLDDSRVDTFKATSEIQTEELCG